MATLSPDAVAAPELSEVERASIILMLLGDDEATAILSRLEPEELQVIGKAMCAMSDIGPERIANAIGGFVERANADELDTRDRPARLRNLLASAHGDFKAESLIDQIAPPVAAHNIELARWLAPPVLVRLLAGEQPQTIAVLLMLLEPVAAAHVLAGLPAELQPEVVERVARLGPVTAQAVEMLNDLLELGITQTFGTEALALGGAREAADLINQAAGAVEKVVMPAITERDAALAAAIEAEMFRFSMVLEINAKDMGSLLREIDNETLIDALKGITEDEREVFFVAMSSRAADGLKEELEDGGKVKRAAVETAQDAIIQAARKLAADGEIEFGAGGGDDDGEGGDLV